MKAILSLGTNIDNRQQHIADAVEAIGILGTIDCISSLYETKPWGFESNKAFINIALILDTTLCAFDLLNATQEIERQLGRTQKSVDGIYHDRPIDIDIIDFNGQITNYPRLTLPHPLMHKRNFVLYPIAEIAPNWQHPILKKNITSLIRETTDKDIPRML